MFSIYLNLIQIFDLLVLLVMRVYLYYYNLCSLLEYQSELGFVFHFARFLLVCIFIFFFLLVPRWHFLTHSVIASLVRHKFFLPCILILNSWGRKQTLNIIVGIIHIYDMKRSSLAVAVQSLFYIILTYWLFRLLNRQ